MSENMIENEQKIVEINCITGEIIERPLSKEEISQKKADAEEKIKLEKEKIAKEEKKSAIKALAMAKLSALGLTEEEVLEIIG